MRAQYQPPYPPVDEEEGRAISAVIDSVMGRSDVPQSELWPKIRLLPGTLKLYKEWHGADYIREKGFNTELADKEFGPGWLDE